MTVKFQFQMSTFAHRNLFGGCLFLQSIFKSTTLEYGRVSQEVRELTETKLNTGDFIEFLN